MPGERVAASSCYGRFSRFELYSIRFEHLAEERKGLKSIELFGTRSFTLYKRRDGDGEIPVGEMLYFSSPRQLSEPTFDPIELTFGDPDWGWVERFDDRQELGSFNTIKKKRVVDRDTDSCAVITYEFIRHCIEAEPTFVVEDPQQRGIKIKITSCNIYALTNENKRTMRMLKHIGPKKGAAACGKGKPVVLDSGDQIKLDRPVLAIPFRGKLQLVVFLTYSFSYEGKEEEGGTIKEFCSTKAPIEPKIASTVFTSTTPGGLDLKLDLSWYDSDILDDEAWDLMDDQDDKFWDLADHAEENIKGKCVDLNPQQEETGDTYTAAPADAAFAESGNGHETLKTEDILHPTGDLQQLFWEMEVPNDKVGVLIGKAGATIQTLQLNSEANVQMARDAEADPYSATRTVELIGTLESINQAEKLRKAVIAEAARPPPPGYHPQGPSSSSAQLTGYGNCQRRMHSSQSAPFNAGWDHGVGLMHTTPAQMTTPGECSQGRQYAHGFTE